MPCMTSTSETILLSLLNDVNHSSNAFRTLDDNNFNVFVGPPSIMHSLHRVEAVGSQPLESFKDMLTELEMSIKHTTWEDLVQTNDRRLYCIPFLGNIHIVLVISKLGLCLLILNDTNSALILMFVPLIHLQQEIAKASNEAAKKYYNKTP
jgi:hypothetical protein